MPSGWHSTQCEQSPQEPGGAPQCAVTGPDKRCCGSEDSGSRARSPLLRRLQVMWGGAGRCGLRQPVSGWLPPHSGVHRYLCSGEPTQGKQSFGFRGHLLSVLTQQCPLTPVSCGPQLLLLMGISGNSSYWLPGVTCQTPGGRAPAFPRRPRGPGNMLGRSEKTQPEHTQSPPAAFTPSPGPSLTQAGLRRTVEEE